MLATRINPRPSDQVPAKSFADAGAVWRTTSRDMVAFCESKAFLATPASMVGVDVGASVDVGANVSNVGDCDG